MLGSRSPRKPAITVAEPKLSRQPAVDPEGDDCPSGTSSTKPSADWRNRSYVTEPRFTGNGKAPGSSPESDFVTALSSASSAVTRLEVLRHKPRVGSGSRRSATSDVLPASKLHSAAATSVPARETAPTRFTRSEAARV